jgi:hypothetical protein
MTSHDCHRYQATPHWSRRQWLARSGMGIGSWALAELLAGSSSAQAARPPAVASPAAAPIGRPGLAGFPHHAAKAKRIIFLYMTGGLSHLESFDHKPELVKRQGEEMPASVLGGKKPLGMSARQATLKLVGSKFPFQQQGQSGAWVSELFPYTAKIADDLCFVKSLYSEAVNHDPALTFMQTGAPLPSRPSIGSWLTYGLGSETADLPAFIALVTKKPADQPLSSRLWDSGFLPTHYQGVQFRSGADAVLYLSNPSGISSRSTRQMLDRLRELHQDELTRRHEAELESRIAQYEMAFRMQSAVPEATDIAKEPQSVLDLYGEDVKKPGSFAANCLLARRLAERGVRCIQLFHPGWDHHGALPESMMENVKEVDQASAALIQDLKQHGMLDDTLVVFGTEFGRTAYSQGQISKVNGSYGREHHRDCFTFWLAGGGIKGGLSYGQTCEFGFRIAEKPVHMNDFHATLLHLMGIEHEKFTHRFQGRDYRLTDVGGRIITDWLA